ncbi:hypothetical protein [Pelagicoccus sp. SDUM812003]|uniref:hypothetical protein n=1 Tax=Pelagicoccus sp. SDUM812003 TaxID=3041267 RepID=UPI00280DD1CA|nr:hypothetical protein [Pelagicoccus sp. SDUM812003]MDQ8205849.1 hypothetical protein [Pelagicoccus sp. SDUM812003]
MRFPNTIRRSHSKKPKPKPKLSLSFIVSMTAIITSLGNFVVGGGLVKWHLDIEQKIASDNRQRQDSANEIRIKSHDMLLSYVDVMKDKDLDKGSKSATLARIKEDLVYLEKQLAIFENRKPRPWIYDSLAPEPPSGLTMKPLIRFNRKELVEWWPECDAIVPEDVDEYIVIYTEKGGTIEYKDANDTAYRIEYDVEEQKPEGAPDAPSI